MLAGWTQQCIEVLMQRDPSLPEDVAAEMANQMTSLGLWRDRDPRGAVSTIFELSGTYGQFVEVTNPDATRLPGSVWSL
jgi:hypothetical protein